MADTSCSGPHTIDVLWSSDNRLGSCDAFSGLPHEVLFAIELRLPVHDIVTLGQISRFWTARLNQLQWRSIFIARWGQQYREEGEERGDASLSFCNARIGQSIWGLAGSGTRTLAPWRSFWRTIENGFIGHDAPAAAADDIAVAASYARAYAQQQRARDRTPQRSGARGQGDGSASQRLGQWLIGAFSLLQPPVPSSQAGLKRACNRPYRLLRWQGGAAGMEARSPGGGSNDGEGESLLGVAPPWRLACILREGQGADVLRCRICNEVDVLTSEMRDWEALPTQSPSWVAPCLCSSVTHRACLEKRARAATGAPAAAAAAAVAAPAAAATGDAGAPRVERRRGCDACMRFVRRFACWRQGRGSAASARDWISFDDARAAGRAGAAQGGTASAWGTAAAAAAAAAGGGGGDGAHAMTCTRCAYQYRLGWRLPRSLRELARVTMEDRVAWKRALSSIGYWGLLVSLVHTLEVRFGGAEAAALGGLAWPEPGGWWLAWWLFQQVVLLQIFFSPRFVHVVSCLWRGPIFAFYCKLYLYFVGACWAFPATWSPALTRLAPALLPRASRGGSAAAPLQREASLPLWLVALGWLNALAYLGVSSVVIFLFWKTNYRLRTVADRRQSTGRLHPILHLHSS